LSWLFAKKPGGTLVTTRLDNSDGQFDITAPVADRKEIEGVTA
jgi:hypothetical protein